MYLSSGSKNSFDVPTSLQKASLRILYQDESAEVPLDLTPTGGAPETERTDTSDALSRAIVKPVSREARTLVRGHDVTFEILGATERRFVNKRRLIFNVRVTNGSRNSYYLGKDGLRLLVEGQATAPADGPNKVLPGESSTTADYVFETSSPAERVVLRGTIDEAAGELPFDSPK